MEFIKTESSLPPETAVVDTSKEEAVKEMLMKMDEQGEDVKKEEISCEQTELSETKPVVEELVTPAPKEPVPVQSVKVEQQSTNGNFKNISASVCDDVLKGSSPAQKLPKEENHNIKMEAEYYESRIRDPYEAEDIPNLECDESIFDDSEESEVHQQVQTYQPLSVMVPIAEVKDVQERENQNLAKEQESKEKKAKTRRKESKEAKTMAVTSSKESVLDEQTLYYLEMNAKLYPNLVRGGTSGGSGMVDEGLQNAEVRRDVEEPKEYSTNETEKKRVTTITQPTSSAKKKAKKKMIGECKELEIINTEAKEVNITSSNSKKNSAVSASSKVSKCDKIENVLSLAPKNLKTQSIIICLLQFLIPIQNQRFALKQYVAMFLNLSLLLEVQNCNHLLRSLLNRFQVVVILKMYDHLLLTISQMSVVVPVVVVLVVVAPLLLLLLLVVVVLVVLVVVVLVVVVVIHYSLNWLCQMLHFHLIYQNLSLLLQILKM